MTPGASQIGSQVALAKACFGACQCCFHPWGFGPVSHSRSDTDIAMACILRRVFSATFWLGNFAALCTRQIHTPQKFAQFATATLFGAAIITAIILAINWLFLQVIVPSVVNLISLFFKIGIIVLLFNAVLRLMSTDNNLLYSVEPNKLLAQIPRTKCGHLILLTVMDHYVEVTTARGKHMI